VQFRCGVTPNSQCRVMRIIERDKTSSKRIERNVNKMPAQIGNKRESEVSNVVTQREEGVGGDQKLYIRG
jgi:hypothetical protein